MTIGFTIEEIPKFSDWNSYETVKFNTTYDKISELLNCEGEVKHM